MGIALKFYSCVGSNHTTLDAIRDDAGAAPVRRRRTSSTIVVHGSQVTVDHVGWKYQPQGLTSAQLNLPFCVATLLLEGDCFVDQFSPAPRTIAAHRARRAGRGARDPAITARGAKHRHMVRVEVQLKNGTRLEGTAETPRGGDQNFASPAEIVAKFEKLAARTLPSKQVGALRDAILKLERLPEVGKGVLRYLSIS